MTVIDIIREYLISHGYDGLYHCNGDGCGCLLDDLVPCGEIYGDCIAGYRIEGCTEECGMNCKFHVGPEKPADKQDSKNLDS